MWNQLAQWLEQPFNPQQGATNWFLFIGFILVSLYLWHVIARDLQMVERKIV